MDDRQILADLYDQMIAAVQYGKHSEQFLAATQAFKTKIEQIAKRKQEQKNTESTTTISWDRGSN